VPENNIGNHQNLYVFFVPVRKHCKVIISIDK